MASSTDTHRATIEAYVEAGALLPEDRVDWGGMAGFEPPDGETWMRVNVLWGDGFEETMSDGTARGHRVHGVVDVQLFGLLGEGYGALFALADTVRDRLNGASLTGGIEFEAASGPRRIPNRDSWLEVNVTVPFSVAETV